MKVLIVGGGIGGLTAAIALAQRDFEVDVLEQQAEPRELGAGISLFANGTRILTSLGIDPALEPLRHCPPGIRLRSGKSGRVILAGQTAAFHQSRFGAPAYNLHRSDLRRALMDAALACTAIRVHPGQRVASVVQEPDGVSVETEQGMRKSGDVLIGADGIHSVVRRAIAGRDVPRFSGAVVWRGLADRDRLIGEASDPFQTIWFGRGCHFLHYLVRAGQLMNVGGFVRSTQWRSESWTEPGKKDDFARLFAGFHPVVRSIIHSCDECFVQAIHEREPLANWFEGRAVLLGDACHAMPPHMGQGAGMAIEDAVVLARALADSRRDLEGALRSYQVKRKERVERVAAAVRSASRVFDMGNSIRSALTQTAMRAMNRIRPTGARERFAWLYGYDALSA